MTTLTNNLHHLALTSLTRYGWVVKLPSSYSGYTGFKIGPQIANIDRLICGFAQSVWRMSVHAPTTYVPPSPISKFLSTPSSYLDINLQVIQRPYITYEPIKLTTWPNIQLFISQFIRIFTEWRAGFHFPTVTVSQHPQILKTKAKIRQVLLYWMLPDTRKFSCVARLSFL